MWRTTAESPVPPASWARDLDVVGPHVDLPLGIGALRPRAAGNGVGKRRRPEHVHVAEKLVDEGRGGPVVDLLGGADLLHVGLVHDDDLVRDLQGLLLVVRHENRRKLDLVMKTAEPAPQILAHPRVQGSERFV